MNSPTLLLIQELIKYHMEKGDRSNSITEARVKISGRNLGKKVMVKVSSNGDPTKTKDTKSIFEFFSNEFWAFFFGRAPEKIKIIGDQEIILSVKELEILDQISCNTVPATTSMIQLTILFLKSLLEGALQFLGLNVVVDWSIKDQGYEILIKLNNN